MPLSGKHNINRLGSRLMRGMSWIAQFYRESATTLGITCRIMSTQSSHLTCRAIRRILHGMRLRKKIRKKNPAAVELGRRGGLARMYTMTPARRIEIAKLGAAARWPSKPQLEP